MSEASVPEMIAMLLAEAKERRGSVALSSRMRDEQLRRIHSDLCGLLGSSQPDQKETLRAEMLKVVCYAYDFDEALKRATESWK